MECIFVCWRKISDKLVANFVMNYVLKVNLECVKLNQRINEAHSHDHSESDQLIENSIRINWLNGGNFGVVHFSVCVSHSNPACTSLCQCKFEYFIGAFQIYAFTRIFYIQFFGQTSPVVIWRFCFAVVSFCMQKQKHTKTRAKRN